MIRIAYTRANNDWGDECEREKESISPSEIPITLVYQTRPSITYHISSIRCHGYYLFAARFVQLLYEGSVYFFGKPKDINDGWIRYIQVRR